MNHMIQHQRSTSASDVDGVNVNYSSTSLEHKLKQLRDDSFKHGQILTQKLASSQSGQNLLHIGTSLSTLPPNLHELITHIHPIISATETSEKNQIQLLDNFIEKQKEIKATQQRILYAKQLELLYTDLVTAENIVNSKQKQQIQQPNSKPSNNIKNGQQYDGNDNEDDFGSTNDQNDIDYTSSLERVAFITLSLLEDLHAANEYFTRGSGTTTSTNGSTAQKNPEDTEHAQFIIKLAPRIRRLESDSVSCLMKQIDIMLKQLKDYNMNKTIESEDEQKQQLHPRNHDKEDDFEERLLLMLGNCMRGLAMLGRGKDVENLFARVSIIPIIRSKLSMGLLDEGGSRGECKGLPNLLNDMITTIATTYGPLICQVESMFGIATDKTGGVDGDSSQSTSIYSMDIDLLTAGVWVPIATALMADNAIRMAIFSPGIASILQANYITLDIFLSQIPHKLLTTTESEIEDKTSVKQHYYRPKLSVEQVKIAQDRIYSNAKTAEFAKKWNLPIYYQLRFGESCTRLNKAIDQTKRYGWVASDVFTGGGESSIEYIKTTIGFEIGLFLELYDILFSLWKPDVIIRPLTNRFLRGAIQLMGRVVSFIDDGMNGSILFGEDPTEITQKQNSNGESNEGKMQNGDDDHHNDIQQQQPYQATAATQFSARKPYCWGDSEEDVASVAWELSLLDLTIRNNYVETICTAISDGSSNNADESQELKLLFKEVLDEASNQIHPIIDKAWNEHIVKLMITKCSGPLGAVKGVAATYRMTNRPPPTHASPFVNTIFRPLKEFLTEFKNRIPNRIGTKWKQEIVVTIAERYALAVEELLLTVQRTEEALKSRKAAVQRRTTGSSGGVQMSDGEKVKLQLFLDYEIFVKNIEEININPATIIGLSKLKELTIEGERLLEHQQQSQSQR